MPRKAANSNNEGDVELRTCCWATKNESTVTVEFLLDGTLANEQVNVERSLRRNRDITIVYVYQDTLLAWEFVKARELTEGRNIPKPSSSGSFFSAKEVVKVLKQKFRPQLKVGTDRQRH